MLVGPTCGGKTVCRDLLADSMGELRAHGSHNPKFQAVVQRQLNPKAITMDELYGKANELTQARGGGAATCVTAPCLGGQWQVEHSCSYSGEIVILC